MRSPKAPPFLVLPENLFEPSVTVQGHDVEGSSEKRTALPSNGTFALSVTCEVPGPMTYSGTGLDTESIVDCVVELRSLPLKFRHQESIATIDPVVNTPISWRMEDIPNAVYRSGLDLVVRLCATVPRPTSPLACSTPGSVLWKKDYLLSRSGTGPVAPIEFIASTGGDDPQWHISLPSEFELNQPASAVMRILVSERSSLGESLRDPRSPSERRLALALLADAVRSEAVIHVLMSDSHRDQIEAVIASGVPGKEAWAVDRNSIGWLLTNWCAAVRGVGGLDVMARNLRESPNDVRETLRSRFMRLRP